MSLPKQQWSYRLISKLWFQRGQTDPMNLALDAFSTNLKDFNALFYPRGAHLRTNFSVGRGKTFHKRWLDK